MAKNQRAYTPEFKQQIVDLHCKAGKGVTELSNEYGIPKGTISSWIKNLTPVINTGEETISLKEYKALQKKMKELEIENEILKKSYWHIRKKSIAEYMSFIQANLDKYTVRQMCSAIKFSRSTYYAALKHIPSKRTQEYQEFSEKVLSVYDEYKQRYGAVKIHRELNDRGVPCSVKRVQRHMKRLGIKSIVVKKYQYQKNQGTVPNDKENILNRNFKADNVFKKLVTLCRRNIRKTQSLPFCPARRFTIRANAAVHWRSRKYSLSAIWKQSRNSKSAFGRHFLF